MLLFNKHVSAIMKIIYLLPFLALISCAESDGNNHGYGYRVDAYDPQYGVSVQYGEGAYQYPVEKISQAFLEVQECMSMTSGSVNVVILDADNNTDGWSGLTYFDPVLVIAYDYYMDQGYTYILKHEFVHAVLVENGYDSYMNSSHDSVFFDSCSL